MPAKTEKEARFMRAVEHGWHPTHGKYKGKKLPSKDVAAEFDHTADHGYAGGGVVCPACGYDFEPGEHTRPPEQKRSGSEEFMSSMAAALRARGHR